MMDQAQFRAEEKVRFEREWAGLRDELTGQGQKTDTRSFQGYAARWVRLMADIFEQDQDERTLAEATVAAAHEAFVGPLPSQPEETEDLILGRLLVFATTWADEHGIQLYNAGVHFLRYVLNGPVPQPMNEGEEVRDGKNAAADAAH